MRPSSRGSPSISAGTPGHDILDATQLSRLAFDLGGVAHVVVEPSRDFSFRLRDRVDGRNLYGGAIGISVPGRGFLRRLWLGPRIPTTGDLLREIRRAATEFCRRAVPAGSWGWPELVEACLRDQRARERKRLTFEETERLYQEELEAKEERIAELEARSREAEAADDRAGESLLPDLLGREVWPGEHLDRLRAVAGAFLTRAQDDGRDDRTLAFAERLRDGLQVSPGLRELEEDLKRAQDPGRFQALLYRHGYDYKSGKTHTRLEPREDFPGLPTVTLDKTGSDRRGVPNARSQLRDALGLKRLG